MKYIVKELNDSKIKNKLSDKEREELCYILWDKLDEIIDEDIEVEVEYNDNDPHSGEIYHFNLELEEINDPSIWFSIEEKFKDYGTFLFKLKDIGFDLDNMSKEELLEYIKSMSKDKLEEALNEAISSDKVEIDIKENYFDKD